MSFAAIQRSVRVSLDVDVEARRQRAVASCRHPGAVLLDLAGQATEEGDPEEMRRCLVALAAHCHLMVERIDREAGR